MMTVISQDKDVAIDTHMFWLNEFKDKSDVEVYCNDILMGIYDSRERADKIFEMYVQHKRENKRIFIMPVK